MTLGICVYYMVEMADSLLLYLLNTSDDILKSQKFHFCFQTLQTTWSAKKGTSPLLMEGATTKGGLRFVSTIPGGQPVTVTGEQRKPPLSVINWDSSLKVATSKLKV